jgi:hypothetical protein
MFPLDAVSPRHASPFETGVPQPARSNAPVAPAPEADGTRLLSRTAGAPPASLLVLRSPQPQAAARDLKVAPPPLAAEPVAAPDLAALRKRLDTASVPGSPGYAEVLSLATTFAERYRRGELAVISTDEARVFTPHLEEVAEAQVPALLRASQRFTRAIAREALRLLLAAAPTAPVICSYGPAGAGKSSFLRNPGYEEAARALHGQAMAAGAIRFESQTFRLAEFIADIHPACVADNGARSITVVQVLAHPAQCAERLVRRFLGATARKDLHLLPQYVLGGYEDARKASASMEDAFAALLPTPVVYVLSTQHAPHVVPPGEVEAIPAVVDDRDVALRAATATVEAAAATGRDGWRVTYVKEALANFVP